MTRQSTATERRYRRWPGLKQAAESLGVNYNHLRLCLLGRRKSARLMSRYAALNPPALAVQTPPSRGRKYLNSPATQPPSINLSAAENLSPAVFATLEKLGQKILIVTFTWADKPEITARMHCGEELGELLALARAGQYDSSFYDVGWLWHFFYSKHLGKALPILRDAIAERGLLEFATILQAEEHNKLCVWYPPTAEQITG